MPQSEQVTIVKADGSTEPFRIKKLEGSLRRSGASKNDISEVVTHISDELEEGMTTNEIYRHAFDVLKEIERPAAARYSLRRALFDLGPSGFPFEDFVAEAFREQGYRTRTGVMLSGKCGRHEMDVLAERAGERVGCELKFHNKVGIKTDMQVALYVHARFEDIDARARASKGGVPFSGKWLVTNTKFTRSAIHYAACAGMHAVGWNYPRKDNLQDLIERTGLHPMTCLTSLSNTDKRRLLDDKVVLCRTLRDDPEVLRRIGVKDKKIREVIEESRVLCRPEARV